MRDEGRLNHKGGRGTSHDKVMVYVGFSFGLCCFLVFHTTTHTSHHLFVSCLLCVWFGVEREEKREEKRFQKSC